MPIIPAPVPALVPVPVPGSVLVDRTLARRKKLRLEQKKNILTGCREIDEYVLLGGFERGSVVGVSSEDDDMGLLIGLQTVAHLLVTAVLENTNMDITAYPKITIITMMPVKVLVPKLRQILVNQVASLLPPAGRLPNININVLVRRCLENVSISMVFDIEGLREVLGEVIQSSSELSTEGHEEEQQPGQLGDGSTDREPPLEAFETSEPAVPMPDAGKQQPPKVKTEILDSEDEEGDGDEDENEDDGPASTDSSGLSDPPEEDLSLEDYMTFERRVIPEKLESSSSSSSKNKNNDNISEASRPQAVNDNDNDPPQPQADNNSPTELQPENKDKPQPNIDIKPPPTSIPPPAPPLPPLPPTPDLILITHMTPLLNALFTGRDKPTAHETMTSLSSQLRELTNRFGSSSTEESGPLIMLLNSTTFTTPLSSTSMPGQNSYSSNLGESPGNQHQQQSTDSTLRSIFQHQNHPQGSKTRPSFGQVFTQLLDLHLLCTRIPRRQKNHIQTQTQAGARAGVSGTSSGGISSASASYNFAWVIEVLLDEIGVYQYEYEYDDDDTTREGKNTTPLSVSHHESQTGGRETQIRRRCREQRWGAVEVEEGGVRIVDVVVEG